MRRSSRQLVPIFVLGVLTILLLLTIGMFRDVLVMIVDVSYAFCNRAGRNGRIRRYSRTRGSRSSRNVNLLTTARVAVKTARPNLAGLLPLRDFVVD